MKFALLLIPFALYGQQKMNLRKRFTTFWLMLWHLIAASCRDREPHVEVCETRGPIIAGFHIGVIFVKRYCWKCGYMPLLFLIFLPLYGQQTVSLRVSGQIQSKKTSSRNFGRLPKNYRAADWTVTSNAAAPLKIPIARLLQEIHTAAGISILSRVSSTSVVEDAQGSSPINMGVRIFGGLATALVACEGLKACGTGGSWPKVILGTEIGAVIVQSVIPTLPSHALQSITAMLPDPVALDPYGTVSGMIIVELGKHVAEPGPLDETIQVVVPK